MIEVWSASMSQVEICGYDVRCVESARLLAGVCLLSGGPSSLGYITPPTLAKKESGTTLRDGNSSTVMINAVYLRVEILMKKGPDTR